MRGSHALAALLLGLALVTVAGPVHATVCTGSLLYGTPINITVPHEPDFVLAGDFNGDGFTDLAVTNSDFDTGGNNSRVAILLGTGPRTFAVPVTYKVGRFTIGLVAADFNHDGITDLAAANRNSDSVSVLIGQGSGGVGNGSFAPAVNYPAGGGPFQLVAVDFDHDGILDLAVSNNTTPSISVLRGLGSGGIGNGTFAAPFQLPLSNLSVGIEQGDFNGDGNPDLVATEYTNGTVALFLGTGSLASGAASFSPASHISAGVEPFDLAVADLNGDNKLDLLVANASHAGTDVLLGNGNGTFQAASVLPSGNSAVVITDDVNGDGILDVAVGTTAGAAAVDLFLGQGSGGVGNGTFGPGHVYPAGFDVYQLAAGDFDHDGHHDLVGSAYLGDILGWIPGVCAEAPPDPRLPVLNHVRDVPNDDGGKVFLTWSPSSLDVSGGAVNQYRVWRRIPPAAAYVAMRTAGRTVMRQPTPRPDGTTDVVYWEAITTLPAQRLQGYGYTAPTTQDSMENSNPYTAFFVSALTPNIDVYYSSNVDSGYSVDNKAPGVPANVAAALAPGGVALHWDANPEPDVAAYDVYRGSAAGFPLDAAHRIATVTDPAYMDPGAQGEARYAVSAVDVHGNEGQGAMVGPLVALGVGGAAPPRLALRGAFPNPSRTGALSIGFTLASRADARLEVLDLAGRVVFARTLRGATPGDHLVALERGQRLTPGLYLLRLTQAGEVRERKATVMR